MNTDLTSQSPQSVSAGGPSMALLQRRVAGNPEDPAALQSLYREAVRAGETGRILVFLETLQKDQPWNHHVRRICIAFHLHHKDDVRAMAAIETLVAFSPPEDALIDSALAVRNRLGPKAIQVSELPVPAISLCMIVKDEAAFLGACLNAIKSLVDEMIIVDTGSADRSADMARIFGARVYDFTWCDDFAAARNASIEKAVGDWILVLDADEIIASRDHSVLRQMVACEDEASMAYSFCTRNYTHMANTLDWHANDRSYPRQETGMGWFPTDKVRLFPRSDRVRFEYPVHELVDASIRQAGIRIENCAIPIHHYGHLNEQRNARKARQYFDLGYAKLEQLGNNPVALRELAVQAGQLEQWPETLELWNRFLTICPQHAEAFANIAGTHWQLGNYDQGIEAARKAIQFNAALKEGHYNLAVNLMMKGKPERAATILKPLLQEQPHYPAALFMLAAAQRMLGDKSTSRKLFDLLKRELSEEILNIALNDLARKLNECGLSQYADLFERQTAL